jgi:hypothetical protein
MHISYLTEIFFLTIVGDIYLLEENYNPRSLLSWSSFNYIQGQEINLPEVASLDGREVYT